GHPLRPATRHCLGAPLPHQLADRPRAPPPALKLSSTVQVDHGTYAVLPGRWAGYSPQAGRLLTCYAPVRRSPPKECPRLACVKHAASVRPEPGSNSPREMKKALLMNRTPPRGSRGTAGITIKMSGSLLSPQTPCGIHGSKSPPRTPYRSQSIIK